MGIVGRPAPNFTGEAARGGEIVRISLSDYRGKWLILFFYPLDFTFVCPTELVALSDRLADFRKADAEVLGVSVDSVHAHLAWMRMPRAEAGVGDLAFPLLSDLSKSIAEAYEILQGDQALRALFLIDPDGIVQSCTVNNLAVGRSVDEVLRTLHAYSQVRTHGDTCPANWREGQPGMPGTLQAVGALLGP